jgi:hypothetical protein
VIAIADFRNPIRAYLGDNHPIIKTYSAEQIDEAVRLVVNLGKIPGVSMSPDPTGDNLSLDVSPSDVLQATNWARIVLYAAQRFVLIGAAANAIRTRAVAMSCGESRDLVFQLLNEIYDLEFGEKGE